MKKFIILIFLVLNISISFASTKVSNDILELRSQVTELSSRLKEEHEFNEGRYSTAKGFVDSTIGMGSMIVAIFTILIAWSSFSSFNNLHKIKEEKKEIEDLINNKSDEIRRKIIEKDTLDITNKLSQDYKFMKTAFPYLDLHQITGDENLNNFNVAFKSIQNEDDRDYWKGMFYYFYLRDYFEYFSVNLLDDFMDYCTRSSIYTYVPFHVVTTLENDNKKSKLLTTMILNKLGGSCSEKYKEYIDKINNKWDSFTSPHKFFNEVLFFKDDSIK